METVEYGWNVLVGSRREAIIAAIKQPRPAPPEQNPFGDGHAAERIAESLTSWPDLPA